MWETGCKECMKGHDVGDTMASIKRARVLYAKYFTISETYWWVDGKAMIIMRWPLQPRAAIGGWRFHPKYPLIRCGSRWRPNHTYKSCICVQEGWSRQSKRSTTRHP